VIATDWQEFASYDLRDLSDRMVDPVMVDLRNMFEADAVIHSGFRHYMSLGRSTEIGGRTRLSLVPLTRSGWGLEAPVRSVAASR